MINTTKLYIIFQWLLYYIVTSGHCQLFYKIIMSKQNLIPERLRSVREALGITKADASRRIGLSKIGYNRYESGERSPSSQTIKVIAEALSTSVDFLVGLTDNPDMDSVQLYRQQDAELFELALEYKRADEAMQERILAYAKAFKK